MPYSFNKILHQTKNFFAYRFVRTYIANSANNSKTNVILSVSKVSKQKKILRAKALRMTGL